MRTEAEIREALELCEQCEPPREDNELGLMARDSTVEALRFCLGIDNDDTSPMNCSLAELLKDLKRDRDSQMTVEE